MTPKRALVVEDDPDIVELVEHYLAGDGWTVDSSGRGREALRKARSGDYQLLVLDLQLPDLDGLSICAEVRRDPKTVHLPIVMLTARGDETDRIVGLEGGADDYIVKPFDPDEVLARARRLLDRPPAPKQRRRRTDSDANVGSLTGRELQVLRLLAEGVGQPAIARELVITPKTVSTHIQRILAKLGVHNQAQAVAAAYRLGLNDNGDTP